MLRKLQKEQYEWSARNFGRRSADHSLFGVVEEVGELSHSHLKELQSIRLNENHEEKAKNAIGDIVIYLMSYCNARGFDFQSIVEETWEEVKQRDWIKYPEKGVPDDSD